MKAFEARRESFTEFWDFQAFFHEFGVLSTERPVMICKHNALSSWKTVSSMFSWKVYDVWVCWQNLDSCLLSANKIQMVLCCNEGEYHYVKTSSLAQVTTPVFSCWSSWQDRLLSKQKVGDKLKTTCPGVPWVWSRISCCIFCSVFGFQNFSFLQIWNAN